MAKLFNDGFDKYAAIADIIAGKFTTGSGWGLSGTTAFGVGQSALHNSNTSDNIAGNFETGSNESTVYLSVRVRPHTSFTSGLTSTYFQLRDGGTAQVTVEFRSVDGTIVIKSGSTGGTVLQTINPALTAGTWDSWQFKFVIHNTAGSVEVRKNGASTPFVTPITNVNTRGGTSNNYVNAFAMGSFTNGASTAVYLWDDLFINSDNGSAPTSWPGDVRLIYSNTSGNVSNQFSPSPSTNTTGLTTSSTNSGGPAANTIVAQGTGFTSSITGMVQSLTLNLVSSLTGHLQAAVYASDGSTGGPGTLLGTFAAQTNPLNGDFTCAVTTPFHIVNGVKYYVAVLTDATAALGGTGTAGTNWWTQSQTYGSGFVTFTSTTTSAGNGRNFKGVLTVIPDNWWLVSDVTNDGDTTYIFDSIVSHKDIFTVAGLGAINPASIIGVDVHVNWKKSDSGARGGTVGVDANGSGDTAVTGITNITPSLSYVSKFGWMPTDPTGAAWTTANINAMKISVSVAS
jgi:hypothetical protein